MNSELEARIQRRERIFLAILQGHYACPDAPDHSHRVLVDNALLGAEEALSALDEADASSGRRVCLIPASATQSTHSGSVSSRPRSSPTTT